MPKKDYGAWGDKKERSFATLFNRDFILWGDFVKMLDFFWNDISSCLYPSGFDGLFSSALLLWHNSSLFPNQPERKGGFCKSVWRLLPLTTTPTPAAKARKQPTCCKDRFLSLSGEPSDWCLCLPRETDCLKCEIANYYLGRLLEGEGGRDRQKNKTDRKIRQTDRRAEEGLKGKERQKSVDERKIVVLDELSCPLWHHL